MYAPLLLAFLVLARATYGLSDYDWHWGGGNGGGCDDAVLAWPSDAFGMAFVMAAFWALVTLATSVLRYGGTSPKSPTLRLFHLALG